MYAKWNAPTDVLGSLWTCLWSSGELGRGKSENSCRRIVGDRSAVDLFVLVFGASCSGEVMIVPVPFAFQVCSLQGLVKLETELARRTGCRAQVKQLKSEKLSPCSSGNLKDSNACASTTLPWPLPTSKVWFLEMPKTDSVLILLPEINDFLQNRQWGSRSISLCFQMEQNTAHFPLIFPGVTHARNWLTDNDLTDRWSAG